MDHLYTPWRMAYLLGDHKAADGGCVFCSAPKADDRDALIVARLESFYVILNLYPYNNGHLMIVPYQHLASPEDLTVELQAELMPIAARAMAALRGVYQPQAFNLGANIGQAAGAGIAEHFHFHVVPRWGGDANFMSTIGETRVLPDTLDSTRDKLSAAWKTLSLDNP